MRGCRSAPSATLDILHGTAGSWEVVEVALDVDAPRFARLFLETLGLSSPPATPAN